MANVLDVADYILYRQGRIPAMKLQKLVYYSQAWALVWDDRALFSARVEAWANGPVILRLYASHRGRYEVGRNDIDGNWKNLSNVEAETIDAVLKYYGGQSSQWLSDLSHAEDPWSNARGHLKPGQRGASEINIESMAEYYGSL